MRKRHGDIRDVLEGNLLCLRCHSSGMGVPISLLSDLPTSWAHVWYLELPCVHGVHYNQNKVCGWQHYPAFHSEISWFQHQISKTKPICMEILRIVCAYSKGVFICWLQCRSHIQQIQPITIFFFNFIRSYPLSAHRNRLEYFELKSNLIKDLSNMGGSLHQKVCTDTVTNLNHVRCYVTAQLEISFWISNWIYVSLDSVLINDHNASSCKIIS